MDQIAPLPEPLTEPLRLFPLGPVAWWQVLLAGLLIWWLWRWAKKKPQPAATPQIPPQPSVPVSPMPAQGSDFNARVHSLEAKYLESEDYREGCHQLAATVRTQLEKDVRLEVEALTAVEMGQLFADPRIGRFSSELRDAQFGRAEPTREIFKNLCRDARHLFGVGKKYELRGRS
jgi:hypothetical protein